jgi:hypothetical protein
LPVASAPDLEQAYRETQYRVYLKGYAHTHGHAARQAKSHGKGMGHGHAEGFFALQVGHVSEPLKRFHRSAGVACSAFITACNPRSQPLSDAENVQRMTDLMDVLKARSLQAYPGVGQHPDNGWPGEPSFLVLGLSLEAARVIAAAFEQNAFVWSGEDAVARLVFSV